jgi:hypothetical protein
LAAINDNKKYRLARDAAVYSTANRPLVVGRLRSGAENTPIGPN